MLRSGHVICTECMCIQRGELYQFHIFCIYSVAKYIGSLNFFLSSEMANPVSTWSWDQ